MNGTGSLSHGLSTYTELLACLAFARHGYEIAVPLPLGCAQKGWDLLVKFDDAGYQRVQVKAAKVKHGSVRVSTVKQKSRDSHDNKTPYEGHEFDVLVAVETDSGVMWLLPMSEVAGRRGVVLTGRDPWVGKTELPSLHEIRSLSRLLKPRIVPGQEALFASSSAPNGGTS